MKAMQNNMRDRLTDVLRRASYIQPFYTSDGELVTSQRRFVVDYDIAEEFADFLIEQGIILPPCKVGQTVYQTDGVRIYKSTIKNTVYYTENIAFDERAIGKTVFLTKEEAERALAERNGEQ